MSEAALRGVAAEQVSWVYALVNLHASKTTPIVSISREKGLRRAQHKTV